MGLITREQFDAAVEKQEEAQAIINAYCKQQDDEFKARWDRFDRHHEAFTDDELTYAAFAKCKKCGAGMAHPKHTDPWHQWTCSNVLKGIGTDKGHEALSFSMYDIKSELQPSANGATTRPQP